MSHQIFKLPKETLISAGAIKPSWKVSFFLTNSTTPTPVYTTSALSVAHTQPVQADSGAVLPAIYLDPTIAYKASVYDQNDVLQYTIDPVNDLLLSQAIIGQYLYPVVPGGAEDVSGIAPTNCAEEYGLITRYGASLASSDNTTAINKAIAVSAAGGAPARIPPGTWYGTATMLAGSALVGSGSRLTTLKIPSGLSANTKIVSGASIAQCRIEGFTVDYTGGTSGTTGHGVYLSAVTRPVAKDIRSVASEGIGFYALNCPEFNFDGITVESSDDWGMAIDGASTIGGHASNLFGKSCANRFLFMRSVQNVLVQGVQGISNGGTVAWMQDCIYSHISSVSDKDDTAGDVAVIEGASIGCTINGVVAKNCGGHTASIASLAAHGAPQNCHIIDVYSDAAGECMGCISDQGTGLKPTNCSIRMISGKNCGRVTPSEAFAMANTVGCRIQGSVLDTLGTMTYAARETGAAPSDNRFQIDSWLTGTSGYFAMSATNSGIEFPMLERTIKHVGDADLTWNPASDGHLVMYDLATLTAARTLTLSDSWPGNRVRVSRISAGAFNLLIKSQGGTTLKTLGTSLLWEDLQFDGTNWNAIAGGSI